MAADIREIADGLEIPTSLVTESIGILAMRGAGKSNLAVVMAEELYAAQLPWVAIDPKGDWWGVRFGVDGESPGIEVAVIGGRHGDVPVHPGQARDIAALIVDTNVTCVIDLSLFTREERFDFCEEFARALYELHGAQPLPRHVFLDEADQVLPQRLVKGAYDCSVSWATMVKLGRHRGLGVTLISQRSAALNKDVLSQIGSLIALRTTGTPDRKAIRDWLDYDPGCRRIERSLPTLGDGVGWVCSPSWLGLTEKVRFRRRRTFDSGATPAATTAEADRRPTAAPDVVRSRLVELGGSATSDAVEASTGESATWTASRPSISPAPARPTSGPPQDTPPVAPAVPRKVVNTTYYDDMVDARILDVVACWDGLSPATADAVLSAAGFSANSDRPYLTSRIAVLLRGRRLERVRVYEPGLTWIYRLARSADGAIVLPVGKRAQEEVARLRHQVAVQNDALEAAQRRVEELSQAVQILASEEIEEAAG